MKAHHYLIIIALALGAYYYFSKKKTKTPIKENANTTNTSYAEEDKSQYAEYAEISTNDAIKKVKESAFSMLQHNAFVTKEDNTSPYVLMVQDVEPFGACEYYLISERTKKALVLVNEVNTHY